MYIHTYIGTPTENFQVPGRLGMSFSNPTDSGDLENNFTDDRFKCSGLDDSVKIVTPISQISSVFYPIDQEASQSQ